MDRSLSDFEERMRREIETFMSPSKDRAGKPDENEARRALKSLETQPAAEAKPARRKTGQTSRKKETTPSRTGNAYKTGHLVRLAVRTKQLEMDTVFEHVSSSISKLEAQLEAEKAARKAGYPIIGYVIETKPLQSL